MEIGIVKPINIEDEMKGAYLDYAMSVITSRALPDVRDGLKPVQRRILFAMDELSLRHTSPYKKSARIVGEVLGKYHPHGDSPVYEAMVRMAQDFSMRYQLVDGQGNFGSVDGDPPAAMRYTEARLARIAEEMLADIDKDTVDFVPNFDGSLKEPSVLPARLPNLLLNGSAGIAVGMATNIPPHNLNEVADAINMIIGRMAESLEGGVPFNVLWARIQKTRPDTELLTSTLAGLAKPYAAKVNEEAHKIAARPTQDDKLAALIKVIDDSITITPDDLIAIVKGPDFPTAGIVVGEEGIENAYATGHGRITIRARVHTEDIRGGKTQIVVTELPYQVNKANLIEKIADLVRERRIEGVSELRDESDRQGMRIIIELKRDTPTKQVLNQLLKYTSMQTTFSINLLALVEGQPRVLTLKGLLMQYIKYRREVVIRRTEYDLAKAKARAHILEGLKIALDNLDEVIATIRRSTNAETAKVTLMKRFKLSEIQAQAILDMQLRRLAALERKKIMDEYAEVLKLIASLEALLATPAQILYIVRDELAELKEKYGDERRTRILAEGKIDFTEEDLIPDQEVSVALTAKNYVKRLSADAYRTRRGAKGKVEAGTKEDDPVQQVITTNMLDTLVVFTNRGRALTVRVRDLPDTTRQARGLPLSNFVQLDEGERVASMVPTRTLGEKDLFVLVTTGGEIKRVAASEFSSVRSSGLIAFNVPEGQDLGWAKLTNGESEIVIVSEKGQAIRFAESEVRTSGRTSGGVRAIRLGADDHVAGVSLAVPGAELLLVTQQSLAKRTPMDEYPAQGRGGGGVRATTATPKTGPVVAAFVVRSGDNLVITASDSTVFKTPIEEIPAMSRSAQGAPLPGVEKGATISAVSLLQGHSSSESDQTPPDGSENGGGSSNGTKQEAKTNGRKRPAAKAGGDNGKSKLTSDGKKSPTPKATAETTNGPALKETGKGEQSMTTTKKTSATAKVTAKPTPTKAAPKAATKASPDSKTVKSTATPPKASAKTTAQSEEKKQMSAAKTGKTQETKAAAPSTKTAKATASQSATAKSPVPAAKLAESKSTPTKPSRKASPESPVQPALQGWIPLDVQPSTPRSRKESASKGTTTGSVSTRGQQSPAREKGPAAPKGESTTPTLFGSIASKLGGKGPSSGPGGTRR